MTASIGIGVMKMRVIDGRKGRLKMKSDVDKIIIRMESVRENLNKTEFDDSEKELVMSAVEEVNSVLEYLRELKAYRATGYTPKQIQNKLKQTEWIHCSERLPEDDEKVLVWFEYFRYGEYNRLYRTIGTSTMYDGEWSGFVNGSSGWHQLRIIAWMPLPEPPVEKGDDE